MKNQIKSIFKNEQKLDGANLKKYFFFFFFINYIPITNYILIRYDTIGVTSTISSVGIVSQVRVSGIKRTYDRPHANSLAHRKFETFHKGNHEFYEKYVANCSADENFDKF